MVDLKKIARALSDPGEGTHGWQDYVGPRDMAAMLAELTAARLLVERLRAIAPYSLEEKYLLAMLSDYDREVQP